MKPTILSIFLFVWLVDGQSWMTQYGQHFKYSCPNGKTISSLTSMYDSRYGDRVWRFVCVDPPNGTLLSNCEWSGYLNDLNQLLEYQCPNENMICGIESAFDSTKKDRKWSYLCCSPEGYLSHACEYTPFINTYGNVLNFSVPADRVLRGVNSVYDNGQKDRSFNFDICKLSPVDETETIIIG